MSKLLEYLHENKIDQIPDDQEFMIAEYDAIYEYCKENNFELDEDDVKTIIGRGLEHCFDDWKYNSQKGDEL